LTKLIVVLSSTTVYTIIRYVVYGDVSPIHTPVYLLNKSVSMSSVLFLFLAALNYKSDQKGKMKFWGMAAWHCACLHVLMSFAILSKAYFPKFFGIEKMNLAGEVTILSGVLAAYCFWLVRRNNAVLIRRRRFLLLSCLFVGIHLVAMGSGGWLTVAKWHGGLPPISLLSFVFAVVSLVLFWRAEEEVQAHGLTG